MTATPDRHDGESFRVSYCGYHIGWQVTKSGWSIKRQEPDLDDDTALC